MLKIGNFSRIANVSIRLLRYYDEIGLFQPIHIDSESGYRYYKTAQIKDLNKILALRDLGLSLEQIKLYLENDLSPDELRGMLLLKKSQLQQTLNEELIRLKRVEYRLNRLESDDDPIPNDVVIKPIPAQPYVSMRNPRLPVDQFNAYITRLMEGIAGRTLNLPTTITVLEHSDSFPEHHYNLEVGFALPPNTQLPSKAITLNNNLALVPRELPAVKQMATVLHVGPWGTGMRSYLELGRWIEAHGFEIVGATREIYMEMARNDRDNNVVEYQLPIVASERKFLL